MPYIVSSRINHELLNNLKKDDAPILFEGLHTCFYLDHPELASRNKSVWMHNIESDYYQNLSKADKNFIHKIHFSVESKKLKKYENILYAAQNIFCVNQKDAEYMTKYCKNTMFVPLFHLNETVDILNESEDYILYHGSLDVVENNQAIVLRDYHADNLMVLNNQNGFEAVGLLDFQDALVGSCAYDLLSLLEDARRDVDEKIDVSRTVGWFTSITPILIEQTLKSAVSLL
jgi:hypothetical protein